MCSPKSPPWEDVVAALVAGEASRAADLLEMEIRSGRGHPPEEAASKALRETFFELLRRRGYFVGSADQIQASLEEIRQVGEGFDLFDLARGLAEYDMMITECRGLRRQRLFPELVTFSPVCPCGKHPPRTF